MQTLYGETGFATSKGIESWTKTGYLINAIFRFE